MFATRLVLVPLLFASTQALAAEGMYLLHQLPAARLKASGLKIDPAELTRRSRAVALVGRGGTGSFVSGQGLLVTNHHVAYRCIARLGASKEHLGLLERGYLARTRADELPCPGYDLKLVRGVRDVTAEVLAAVKPKLSWARRFEAIRLRKEDLVTACEKGKRQVCQVTALDGGRAYLLSSYTLIKDVRLVYAPPKALGKYGGDVDNWIYPRHTADFTFLRAYVGQGGAGAAYAAQNVPLQTPVHLEVSPHGVRRGSLALVIGFPAQTARHVTSQAARFYVEQRVPGALQLLGGLAGVVHARMKASPDARRKYAGLEAGLLNALKYYRMSGEGMRRWKVLARKLEQERALLAALQGDRERGRRYRALQREIDAVYGRYRRYYPRLTALERLLRVCASVRVAHSIARWSSEKAKPERMRKEEDYKEKNLYRLRDAARRLDREIELETEKALLLHMLRLTEQLPRGQRLQSTARLLRRTRARGRDPLRAAVDVLYAGTRLLARADDPQELARAVEERLRLLDAKRAVVVRDDDPLLRFARDLEAELTALREGPHREVEQYLGAVLQPRWVEQFLRPSYPDADFTVRLSYGSVRDYTASADGKRHRYMTSLAGLLRKDRGQFPFAVPARLKAAFGARLRSPHVDRQLKDIPVNFTTTLDTTGGNSGSPVLDDRGRLVGLLFDGTPESILSDWQYLPRQQRSICMDIRLALYLAGVDGATRVLAELGVTENKE